MADGNLIDSTAIWRGAVISGLTNAVINGAIQLVLLRGENSIPLSVDAITNDRLTVFGTAVPLAVSLAAILTVVTFATLKTPKRRFYPGVLWLTVKHAVVVLGLCIALGVLWQRVVGSVTVPLLLAVVILACIAGLAAGIISYRTIRASVAQ